MSFLGEAFLRRLMNLTRRDRLTVRGSLFSSLERARGLIPAVFFEVGDRLRAFFFSRSNLLGRSPREFNKTTTAMGTGTSFSF